MTRDYSKFTLPTSGAAPKPHRRSMLETLGWQPFFAQQISIEDLANTPPVRVVEVNRNALSVVGDELSDTIPPRADITVGDWLLFDAQDPKSSRLLDRKSLLKRRAPGSETDVQLIAANIDTAFIVTSCNQDFNIARLERYVALAFEAEVDPVILLTKSDLTATPKDYVEQAQAISEMVSVVALDARSDEPVSKLAAWCKPGKTVAFLGSSGVGKSTLTNALTGAHSVLTQGIREDDAKGRHTTTRRQLHVIPDGCLVLDMPGMRELQLIDAAAGIDDLFADIHDLSTHCRFNDCQHSVEPGCAVMKAVEAGTVDAARLARWRKLMAEEAFFSATLAQRRTKDRSFGKMVKQMKKQKKKRD